MTNTPDLLEKIRAKCIEVNPEIVELKFGCRAKWNNPASEENRVASKPHDIVVIRNWNNGPVGIMWENVNLTRSTATVFSSDLYDIIGRPIRLADVLLAIDKVVGGYAYAVSEDGHILLQHKVDELGRITFEGTGVYWNLRKDSLEDQSPECITFISSILGV